MINKKFNEKLKYKFAFFCRKDYLYIKKILFFVKPYKYLFIATFIIIITGIALSLIQPLLWGKILSSLFMKNYDQSFVYTLFFFVVFAFQALLSYIQGYSSTNLINKVIYDLKNKLYKKILNMPVKYFDEMGTGDFVSRIHNDTSVVSFVIMNLFINTAVDILKIFVVGITVFNINALLASIVILGFPFSYLIFKKYSILLREKNNKILSLTDDYLSKLNESICGIRDIKAIGLKNIDFRIFSSLSLEIRNNNIELNILSNTAQTATQAFNYLSQLLLILIGGYFVCKETLSIEYFVAFFSYSSIFNNSLLNLTKVNSSLQQVFSSSRRIFELIDNSIYQEEEFGDNEIEQVVGKIKFEEVKFEYMSSLPVLRGITFEIPCNKTIAIVGNSGSGKSTILNLLLRFYDPLSGAIYIDDINIKDLTENKLRKNISIVRQNPMLFNKSIKDNLMEVNPNATEDEMLESCKLACIHDFIMTLPKKYETYIGENGVLLSIGQKQRIAIARAILKKSKIILFDEATSSLDNNLQSYINTAIKKISKNHTVIIVAHKLSAIIEADEIFVLDQGVICDSGKHEFLIQHNSLYNKMFKLEAELLIKNGSSEKTKEEILYDFNGSTTKTLESGNC